MSGGGRGLSTRPNTKYSQKYLGGVGGELLGRGHYMGVCEGLPFQILGGPFLWGSIQGFLGVYWDLPIYTLNLQP